MIVWIFLGSLIVIGGFAYLCYAWGYRECEEQMLDKMKRRERSGSYSIR